MPELPDLEGIRIFLNQRLPDVRIEQAEVLIPFIVRAPKGDFIALMEGNAFGEISRRGKFLFFPLKSGHTMVVNAMLTGRFQWSRPKDRRRAKTCWVLRLENGQELRYVDQRLMGKVYLAKGEGDFAAIRQLPEIGPDALAPELTEQVFTERPAPAQIGMSLNQRHRRRQRLPDEILFAAKLHPYRKRRTLSDDDVSRLYQAMRSVLETSIPLVVEGIDEELPLEEVRYFMKVHRRGGKPCPVCGGHITDITAGDRVTSFCRACQL
jgi:formamidopyrimidine-DNA glycosylase